jgi:phospholipid/cholesterol/gamma-HCH transport system permease protein
MTTATETRVLNPEPEATERAPSQLRFYVEEIADLIRVAIRTLYYIFRGKREKGDIIKQCFDIGNKSMFFMSVTMAFIGAIVLFQMCMQAKRIIPDLTLIGGMYAKLLIRELAPSVGAMPLATRVGAGIAAEIGSMVVTEQTDALRMSGADPVDYLVVPRLIASIIMGTIVLVLGAGVAYGAGYVIGVYTFDINPNSFVNFSSVKGGDVALGLIKCVCYGGIIALVSSQRGLRTFGGSEGVGIATTEAVVGSLFAVILTNFVLSGLGFFVFPP